MCDKVMEFEGLFLVRLEIKLQLPPLFLRTLVLRRRNGNGDAM